ncbi:MAG: thiamine ABC transporter ATP-binding protein [Gammaproteobacteria bacterium]|nr:thiamine ABC transporter ATP-binding protein [Gammaproteobacteria bacterium]
MITLDNLIFQYDKKSEKLCFDMRVERAEKVALIGPSGVGKSTLLSLISGFAIPESGDVWLNGDNHTTTIPHLRPVSILFQDNNLFHHLSVLQNIALGIAPNMKIDSSQRDQIHDIAEKVGLGDYLSRLPEQLSGGQQQRVALARCLLRDKPILLLDEPFSALDKSLRLEMMYLLNDLADEKSLTILMVTHQVEEVTEFVDRTIALS